MLSHIQLNHTAETPLYRQLYASLRKAILEKQLTAGSKLPASRQLAKSLGVSRNTIKNAFEQLLAEGYLEARTGAGTFVTRQLPDELTYAPQTPPSAPQQQPISRLAQHLKPLGKRSLSVDLNRSVSDIFLTGVPALDEFPFDLWARLMGKVSRKLPATAYGYGRDSRGYAPLREAIVTMLRRTRAIRCTADQIVITSGTQMGLYILGQALLNRDDAVWVEEPGYGGSRGAMMMAGATIIPVPVDREGMQVDVGIERGVNGRLAIVTPSHHFPLGGTMSLSRRLQLLAWAEQQNAWIIEDDYDSVFHYDRLPLSSLHGLAQSERVIYAGTFSKVLFPALRLAYLVLPLDLVHVILGCKITYEQVVPILSQATLAEFIVQGHFVRHLRRMNKLYHRRRDFLLAQLKHNLGDQITIGAAQCGMHLAVGFNHGITEKMIRHQLNEMGFRPIMVGDSAIGPLAYQGIMLNFASANEANIKEGVLALTKTIHAAEK